MDQALTSIYLSTGWSPLDWWFAVALATFADLLTTVYLLRIGGHETNKPLAWLMGRVGTAPALILVKGSALVGVWIWLQEAVLYLPAVAGLYVALTAWNLYWIWWQRRAVAARLRGIEATD